MREETGITADAIELRVVIDSMVVDDGDRRWRVHPFLFDLAPDAVVELDWENSDLRWIRPNAIDTLDTVPALGEVLRRCLQAEAERDG